ncbi:hypothetical protein SB49_13995 [Sediminicola sp. YIK13]|nr:hypothetical protein SB49_13995 [Sediminicola sp. YIK13]
MNITWLGLAVMLFLSYKLAISNTIELHQELGALSKEEQIFKDIPKQISMYSGKKQYYDSLLTEMNVGNSSLENNLLRVLNSQIIQNNLKLIDFNKPHIFIDNDTELNTYTITMEGGFSNILKTVHSIEQRATFGEILHIEFFEQKDYKNNKEFLRATLLVQHIR